MWNWTVTVGHIHIGTLPKMKGRNLGGAVARRDSHFENPPYSTVSFTALDFVAHKRWSGLHHICRHYLFQGGHWKHPNLQINDRPSQPENPGILKSCFALLPTSNPKIWGASGGQKKNPAEKVNAPLNSVITPSKSNKSPKFVHQIKYAHRRWKTASSLTLRSKSSNSCWSLKVKLVAYSPERPGKRRDLGQDASKLDLKTHEVLESQRSRNLFWSLVSFQIASLHKEILSFAGL